MQLKSVGQKIKFAKTKLPGQVKSSLCFDIVQRGGKGIQHISKLVDVFSSMSMFSLLFIQTLWMFLWLLTISFLTLHIINSFLWWNLKNSSNWQLYHNCDIWTAPGLVWIFHECFQELHPCFPDKSHFERIQGHLSWTLQVGAERAWNTYHSVNKLMNCLFLFFLIRMTNSVPVWFVSPPALQIYEA